VLFDGWYSSLVNRIRIDVVEWRWLTRLKHNRRMNPDMTGNRPVGDCKIAPTGTMVHLENHGMVRVFRIIFKDGTAEHWTTNDLEMDELGYLRLVEVSWKTEGYPGA